MAKSTVRKIWMLEQPNKSSGKALVYRDKKSKKRKKQLAVLKPLEKVVRTGSKSGKKLFSTYLRGQNKSNRKRKNGWVVDFPLNVVKANNKAIRNFKLPSIIGM